MCRCVWPLTCLLDLLGLLVHHHLQDHFPPELTDLNKDLRARKHTWDSTGRVDNNNNSTKLQI